MAENMEQKMEEQGWVLARSDQPGIYIRQATIPAEDTIDWVSEPTELLTALREREERKTTILERYRAQKLRRLAMSSAE